MLIKKYLRLVLFSSLLSSFFLWRLNLFLGLLYQIKLILDVWSSYFLLLKVRSMSVYSHKILTKLVTSGAKKSAVVHDYVNENEV